VGRLLADDTFERPEDTLFSNSTTADGRGHFRLVGGLYVMTLPQPGAGWLIWGAGLEPGDHVTQVTARLIGKPGAWGVFTHGVITKARSDGTVEVVPGEWNKQGKPSRLAPVKPAAAFEAEKWNTLAVTVRAGRLTVYLNGRQVGGPISSDRGPGSTDCGMVLFQDGPGDARAEFRRFTVWELNDQR
jgi:hypothetical protein